MYTRHSAPKPKTTHLANMLQHSLSDTGPIVVTVRDASTQGWNCRACRHKAPRPFMANGQR
jgi:hypothetical protein